MNSSIYLDYNATAPVRPDVINAMTAAMTAGACNASSIHGFGRTARKGIEDARADLAALINVTPKQIIFNSGATEGNNTVLRFFGAALPLPHEGRGGPTSVREWEGEGIKTSHPFPPHPPSANALGPSLSLWERGYPRILISATEHPSVIEAGKAVGAEIISVLPSGTVDLTALEKMCATGPAPALVSVMYVNNETGVINPVADVARIAHAYGAAVHVDAVQALGKIPLDFTAIGADFMTLCAHKCGGPQGVGALIIGNGETGACLPPPVLMLGGGQERSLRAGTENVAAIAGFGLLAKVLKAERADRFPSPLVGEGGAPSGATGEGIKTSHLLSPHPPSLRFGHPLPQGERGFCTQIERILLNARLDTVIFGADAPRVPNTVCFAVPGMDAQTLLMQLDLGGVAVSSGSACSSGKVRQSHVLQAMGVDPNLARGAIRISTGWATTEDQIEQFARIWQKIIRN